MRYNYHFFTENILKDGFIMEASGLEAEVCMVFLETST
jgi:hypothetical protein